MSAGAWGVARGGFLTLVSALKNARYLNLMIRRSDIATLACRSNMTNSLGSGMIQTNPAGLYKAPSYYVMKLYADHAKQVYVPIEGAPDSLDIVATASEDGKSLCVFAASMGAEPVELTLDLSAYPGMQCVGGETVQDTLDRRQAEVVNGWARPDRMRAVELKPTSAGVTVPAFSASAIEINKR